MFKFLIKRKSSENSTHLAKYSTFSWFFLNNVLKAKALHQIEITWQRYKETTSALYFRVRGSIDSSREFARFGRFRSLIIYSLFKKKITMSHPLQASTTASESIKCTVSDCWRALQKLRSDGPLVQCITNYVSMDIMANTLLAIGASPAMAHGEFDSFMFSYSRERQ